MARLYLSGFLSMNTFQTISASAAHEMLAQPQTQLIDIRDEFAFREGHIEGAVRVDNNNVGNFIGSADKSAPLIICCYHGISSQSVAHFFVEQGFTSVYSLNGGFEGWKLAFPYVC